MQWRGRARLVATALAVGVVVGLVAVPLFAAFGFSPRGAAGTVFALGTLAFGFGLVGWSGSIILGDAVEIRDSLLGKDSDWTEPKSRRAMVRVGSFGFGVMLGSSVAEVVVVGV
ncbi:hypothetical protein [Haloarchaeobius sp. HME9146]|uniref:DUF7268 family protein n=1 Tax=Haloarchaeobius sp. HME9146 TaxID=2978732 RepID=UPI0021BFB65F|nr:hypothetical protein [Haloarchaeobius sp. HME9146]MCT9095232.1 hypothetical protein [Haloarchaeobius sp. HME9146]